MGIGRQGSDGHGLPRLRWAWAAKAQMGMGRQGSDGHRPRSNFRCVAAHASSNSEKYQNLNVLKSDFTYMQYVIKSHKLGPNVNFSRGSIFYEVLSNH